MLWITAAWLSAISAAAATLFIKCYVKRTDSSVVTLIQTLVMLAGSFLITLSTGGFGGSSLPGPLSLFYMILSGISTGLTWLCYYKALQDGSASRVMPIEKANIVLTILIAIFLFHERSNLTIKLVGVVVILAGIMVLLWYSTKSTDSLDKSSWLTYALLSSLFAALNTIFSKLSLSGMGSNLGTTINTAVALPVILLFAGFTHKLPMVKKVPASECVWIILSGLSTCSCWLCYYYAVKYGPMTVVAPVNKMSVPIVILFSTFFLKEKTRPAEGAGLFAIVIGMLGIAAAA
ncbi:MAG: EamA family transporter [Blautia sp.]|nr:EamA family transporter [Blautia sp.]